MLEVGCSNARILYLARKDGWIVKGIELFESTAQLIKEEVGIDIEVANFLEVQVDSSDKFDIVILRHVLEHLPNPIHAMNQINSLLKDDGYTLLEFPNVDGFKPKLKRWMDKKGLRKKKIPADAKPAGHYHEFSKQSIELLLSKTGFVLHDFSFEN
jgi:2-polyprenyl-3-methyl-5-hydroxy-6-metoxy-1,4-benzoquinol methylase